MAERKTHSRPTSPAPLHGSRIEDYGLIGDCETAALVSRTGSIDWLCWPTFSSPACFAALLGTRQHGHWQIAPAGKVRRTARRYRPHTLILETVYATSTGRVEVLDFMPPRGKNSDRDSHSNIVRIVRGLHGHVAMQMEMTLRFDYGRTVPWVTGFDQGLRAIAGPDMVVLRTSAPLEGSGKGEAAVTSSKFTVRAGQTVTFTLTYASSLDPLPAAIDEAKALTDTETFWTDWAARNTYSGPYAEAVERSLITLKALTYEPSGGIVAAPTTSLPEQPGGPRNWDYRYCWLRDTAFTLLVLMRAGYIEESVAWRRWLLRATAGAPGQIQTIYDIRGERQVVEWCADWLPGYRNSRPVRIGNAASSQFQLDVYGEISAALARTPQAEDDIRVDAGALEASLINRLCEVWREPDSGIWEVRGRSRHFTFSKVMAWRALDLAIRNYERYDGGADVERWRRERDLIHDEVCARGFSKKLNSFTQYYGSQTLDASCLRIAMVGFLPADDPRIIGTIEAIQSQLMQGGLVQRYKTRETDDGLTGGEGTFLACSFWLVNSLWLIGRRDEATALFERLLALRNDLGLLAEEYDPQTKHMLGNFPQALSHIALAHAAFTLIGQGGAYMPEAHPARDRTKKR